MKHSFKKIAVCNGPSCELFAPEIQKSLTEQYKDEDVVVANCSCCGRCSERNTIVIDDEVVVSNLDRERIRDFIKDPEAYIEKVKREDAKLSDRLDAFLSSDDLV
ncbi:(2Fe-2S) ferredoxin domain-containing protein [Candidatus Uhrbacteria bacterium]|nr:(2Fe-2S) ferredoxin domain-containing protein [Candidatus Uhrbacteria bacterium]